MERPMCYETEMVFPTKHGIMMYMSKKDLLRICLFSLGLLVLSAAAWSIWSLVAILLTLCTGIIVLIALQVEVYRRLQGQCNDHFHVLSAASAQNYGQLEALFSLFALLDIKDPLPPMRSWAISPDYANLLLSVIKENRPNIVVETGSGVSTLIAAYALKQLGCGRLISFEHDREFALKTGQRIERHKLKDIAMVIYAPLKLMTVGDKEFLWYDVKEIDELGPIDLLIIDGPPGYIQPLSRYPALPILEKCMNGDGLIVLDDAHRNDEKEIINLWLDKYRDLEVEFISTEKGAAILCKANRIKKYLW